MPLPALVIPAALKALPWKWIGIGVGAAIVVGVVWWRIDAYGDARYKAGEAGMKAKWVESANRWKAYTDRLGEKYRAVTTTLQADADTIRNEKDQNDARNRAVIADLTERVRRERNRRPAGVMSTASTVTSAGRPGTCTLGDVYAEDAGLALDFAGDTESVNNQLRQCWSLYNRARDALKETSR